MTEFTFEVPGRAVAKQRARPSGDWSRKKQLYTPKKTVLYESFVGFCYRAAANAAKMGPDPTDKPVTIEVVSYFAIPKSVPKYRKAQLAAEREYYASRPDADNILKSVLDGLNGIAYKDDRLVVGVSIQKLYGTYERTVVTIREVGPYGAEEKGTAHGEERSGPA